MLQGAGDAFIGALAYYRAMMPQLPLPEAIKRASQVASISCEHPGTQSSFPTTEQLCPELFASVWIFSLQASYHEVKLLLLAVIRGGVHSAAGCREIDLKKIIH